MSLSGGLGLAEQADLVTRLSLRDDLSRGLLTANRNLKAFGVNTGKIGGHISKGLSNASQNLQRIGLVAAGVAAGGIAAAARAAIDFEDAFAGIEKTVDEAALKAAGLTFEQLERQIRDMALEIPIAATELAAIGEAAGALGIRAQDIDEFVAVVAKLGVTTNLTSDAAATALGHLGTILHLTGEEFEDFADVLVALGNSGASTEDQIVGMAERFAAAGNSAGLTKEDILALASAVASMGIEVEAGGSALSRVFNNVATNIGTSSAKADEFAKALGLSAKEFRDAWEEDALGTFQEFLGVLNTLDQFEAAALLKKVGITNTRDVSTVRLMAQNIGFVNEALETSRTATGALGEEAGKKFATTRSQLQLLKNTLVDIGITVGNELLPVIVDLSKEARTMLGKPENQAKIKQFAQDLGKGIREMVAALKGVDWAGVAGSLKTAAGFGKSLLDAFMGAPPWLKTAVLTGWGLNKLTGGAVGGIIGELGKGLIKGVLGMNANIVNLRAGVVNGAGVGGAAGAAGGGGLVGTMKVLGSLFIAGVAIDQLLQQFDRTSAQIAQASNSVLEKVATIPDKTYAQALAAVNALEVNLETQSGDMLRRFLMQTGSGRMESIATFEAWAKNLQRTATTPEERAAATAAIQKLAEEITLSFGNSEQDRAALLAQLQTIASVLQQPPPAARPERGGFVSERAGVQERGVQPVRVVNSPDPPAPAAMFARFAADFASRWGTLRDQLHAQFGQGAQLRRSLAEGLGISAGKLDRLHTVMRGTIATELGITSAELRAIKRQSGHNEEQIAARLGISVEQLRAIRERARETASGVVKLNNKDWTPKIVNNITIPVRVGITGRTLYDSNNRQRTVIGGRSVE